MGAVRPSSIEVASEPASAPRAGAAGRPLELARLQDWLRRGWRNQRLGQPEQELLSALGRVGCPVCHALEGGEWKYFFWFCNDTYYELEVQAELTHSLGFCPDHGAYALRACGERSPFATSHQAIVRRLRETWRHRRRRNAWEAALAARGGAPARCPTCRVQADEAESAVFFLARLLDDPRFADQYAKPGMLCWPHLQLIAPRLGAASLERLVHFHEAFLRSITPAPGRKPCDQDFDGRALWLAAGHDPGIGALPAPGPGTPAPSGRDPVASLERDLRAADACPVCLEVGRAWVAWITWLHGAARRGEAFGDLLPTCAGHVWASFHAAGPELRPHVVGRALGVALAHLGHASARFEATPPKPWTRQPLRSLGRMLRGRAPEIRAARATLLRDFGCPLCDGLAAARDRTLLLLLALLEDRPHRAAFETSYGLCLRHYGRALALAPEPGVRGVLRAVEAARLARLEWELVEYARKSAWQARPEPKGAEQLAPVHAIRRFSGNLDQGAGAAG